MYITIVDLRELNKNIYIVVDEDERVIQYKSYNEAEDDFLNNYSHISGFPVRFLNMDE